jgi:hypothetical protein
MGPNLRLSCTTLCKKHMTNSSCRHSCLQVTSQHAVQLGSKHAVRIETSLIRQVHNCSPPTACILTESRHHW